MNTNYKTEIKTNMKKPNENENEKDPFNLLNLANFLNNLADWLEDNVEYDADDEFDRKLSDIRYQAQDLYDRCQH